MNPMALAAISSIANIGGGILGNELSKGDRNAAENQIKSIQDMYNSLEIPDIEKQKLALQQYGQGQMISPEEQQIRQMSMQDQLQNIQLDPRLKQTQMNALDVLSQISGKGFTPDELNAMEQQRSAREADTTAKLKQIQQQQDMRGTGTSEMGMAQQMLAAQSDANRGAQDARDMQAQAFRRSLDAVSQGANLANQIDTNDYNRQSALASALRNRESTNFQTQVGTEGSNVDRFNRALESNVNRSNKVSDANVDLSNQQQMQNKGLYQQDYNNRLTKLQGQSGAATGMANMYQNKADSTAKMWSSIGSGIGSGVLAMNGKDDKKVT